MKKSATEEPLRDAAAAAEDDAPEGARQRLLRAFLRELPIQVELALERWAAAIEGDADTLEAVRNQLHRLKGEAAMLHLTGHAHLFAALRDVVSGLPQAEPIPERVVVAVRVAIAAVAKLEGRGIAHAEQAAAQLRWMTQDSEEMSSGVFPKR